PALAAAGAPRVRSRGLPRLLRRRGLRPLGRLRFSPRRQLDPPPVRAQPRFRARPRLQPGGARDRLDGAALDGSPGAPLRPSGQRRPVDEGPGRRAPSRGRLDGLASRARARPAAGFMLATSWLAWSALSGMEIPLFVFLSTGAIGLHLRERRNPARPPLSLGLFGLSILARPEGAFLLVLAVLDRLLVSFARAEDGALVWRPARPRP